MNAKVKAAGLGGVPRIVLMWSVIDRVARANAGWGQRSPATLLEAGNRCYWLSSSPLPDSESAGQLVPYSLPEREYSRLGCGRHPYPLLSAGMPYKRRGFQR